MLKGLVFFLIICLKWACVLRFVTFLFKFLVRHSVIPSKCFTCMLCFDVRLQLIMLGFKLRKPRLINLSLFPPFSLSLSLSLSSFFTYLFHIFIDLFLYVSIHQFIGCARLLVYYTLSSRVLIPFVSCVHIAFKSLKIGCCNKLNK